MKKIYFSYSDQPEDQSLYQNLNSHLQLYKRKGWIEIYDERELFKQNGDINKNAEFLKHSDLTIPLISIDYLNNDACRSILKIADDEKIKIVPVILRQCDWKSDDILQKYCKEAIPEDESSVESLSKTLPDKQIIFKQIGDDIKCFVFPELQSLKISNHGHQFYWILSSFVLAIGITSSVIVYNLIPNGISFAVLVFLVFAVAALFCLKSVLFPTKLSDQSKF